MEFPFHLYGKVFVYILPVSITKFCLCELLSCLIYSCYCKHFNCEACMKDPETKSADTRGSI